MGESCREGRTIVKDVFVSSLVFFEGFFKGFILFPVLQHFELEVGEGLARIWLFEHKGGIIRSIEIIRSIGTEPVIATLSGVEGAAIPSVLLGGKIAWCIDFVVTFR